MSIFGRKKDKFDLIKAMAMYKSGQSTNDIAKSFSRSVPCILFYFHRNNFKLRTRKQRDANPLTRQKISLSKMGNKNPNFDKHPINYKGGHLRRDGYKILSFKKHAILEHRLIASELIGRALETGEQVHHLGKRNDNRPHKLMVFATLSAHRRFEFNPKNVKPEEIIYDGRKNK